MGVKELLKNKKIVDVNWPWFSFIPEMAQIINFIKECQINWILFILFNETSKHTEYFWAFDLAHLTNPRKRFCVLRTTKGLLLTNLKTYGVFLSVWFSTPDKPKETLLCTSYDKRFKRKIKRSKYYVNYFANSAHSILSFRAEVYTK